MRDGIQLASSSLLSARIKPIYACKRQETPRGENAGAQKSSVGAKRSFKSSDIYWAHHGPSVFRAKVRALECPPQSSRPSAVLFRWRPHAPRTSAVSFNIGMSEAPVFRSGIKAAGCTQVIFTTALRSPSILHRTRFYTSNS